LVLEIQEAQADYAARAEGRGMKEDLDSAAQYLQRAEELRGIAEATKDLRARETLLDIAKDYERMAASRKRIE
jgi:hypothetical protein